MVVKEKIYGCHLNKALKVLSAFKEFERSLGVIMSGAKALTEAVKDVGFGGFCENAWDCDVALRHLCFLKAAGLGHPEWMMPKYADDDSPARTSFEDELRLLNFEF